MLHDFVKKKQPSIVEFTRPIILLTRAKVQTNINYLSLAGCIGHCINNSNFLASLDVKLGKILDILLLTLYA